VEKKERVVRTLEVKKSSLVLPKRSDLVKNTRSWLCRALSLHEKSCRRGKNPAWKAVEKRSALGGGMDARRGKKKEVAFRTGNRGRVS